MRARLPGATWTIAACVVTTLGFASCGGSGAAPKAIGPSYEISTGQVGGLGSVLVDGQGYTLYLYVPDDHSSHSVCNGVCAVGWPPLLLPQGVHAAVAGPGVDPTLLGVTRRADGSTQITYGGWPLYRWSNDTPGEDTGQGLFNLGGLWYVVSPDGNAIR